MSERRFEIESDIRRAETPPGWVYTDARTYARMLERVFAPSWCFIGDERQAGTPGHVVPLELFAGSLDEPIVLSRDREDRLHCLSNVCTHRGMRVVEHGGHERCLTCRYHGRRFELDGSFKSMPEFEEAEGFPRAEDSLRSLDLSSWRGLLFCSLDAGHALDDVIGPLEERIGFLPIADARLEPERSREYLVHANWALYVENYLEGFHIPFVHESLSDAIDYGSYETHTFDRSNLQIGVAGSGDEAFELPTGHVDAGKHVAAWYFWLWPATMFNVYPWGISANIVDPLGVDRTRVRYRSYVWDASKLDRGASADLDRVEREDEAIVEAIQKSIGSRLYSRGRYSPTRERCVHHFHRLLARALDEGTN